MKGNQPTVTVLMPVYNAGPYLAGAIESILGQVFGDFEFLIIDDGSTDGSREVIRRYSDPRIRFYENSGNLGLVRVLNRGLALARGKYLARMDADDISLPERLKVQVEFMESHGDVGICGAWSETIGVEWSIHFPASHDLIRVHLLFNCAITHPTAIIRRSLLARYGLKYRSVLPQKVCAEDYDLWVRAGECFQLANLPVVLLHYRCHPNQTCNRHREEQFSASRQIQESMLARLGLAPEARQMDLHEALSTGRYETGVTFVRQTLAWFDVLYRANRRSRYLDETALSEVLVRKYLHVVGNHRAAWRAWLHVRPGYGWLIRGLLKNAQKQWR